MLFSSCTPMIVIVIPPTSTQNSAQRPRAPSITAQAAASGNTTAPDPRLVRAFATSVSHPARIESTMSPAVTSPGVGPGSPPSTTE